MQGDCIPYILVNIISHIRGYFIERNGLQTKKRPPNAAKRSKQTVYYPTQAVKKMTFFVQPRAEISENYSVICISSVLFIFPERKRPPKRSVRIKKTINATKYIVAPLVIL